MFFLEEGAENPSQRADTFCDQEVLFHELLDPARTGLILVTHERGNFGLDVKGETFFRAAGQVMQVASHPPQKLFRALKSSQL